MAFTTGATPLLDRAIKHGIEIQPEDRLPRRLGVWSTGAVLVGITIGSGIFRVPSVVAAEVGSVGGAALVWLLGAAITLCGAVTLTALTAAYPRPGGAYVVLREGYGDLVAFLFGWIKLLVTGPTALAAIALIFAAYARAFVPLSDGQVKLVAGGLIAVLSLANIRSVAWSAALQSASTAAKVVVLALLALLIFAFGDAGGGAFDTPTSWRPASWGGFWVALIAVLWTYTGWVDMTYAAGEVREPTRTLPRALAFGMAIIVAVYLLANAAYLFALPLEEMAASELVAADAAQRIFGARGSALVAALVMVSALGALNGSILTSPRVFFSLAADGLFFRGIAAVHPRYRTPHVALLLYMLLGIAGVATRTFEQLAEIFVLGIWPFYALAVGALFTIRAKRPDLAWMHRGRGYPLLALVFLLVSALMLVNGLVHRPLEWAIGVLVLLLGVPAYYGWRAARARLAPANDDAAVTGL